MREILFRGKRKDNGKWVEGFLIHIRDYCCILELDCENYGNTYLDRCFGYIDGCAVPVDPETVGQFIGVLDKNSKKIFEGDIVHTVNRYGDSTSIVVFSDHKFGLDIRHFNEFSMEQGLSMRDSELGWTVVGNIHDNPEILEGKSDGK